MLLAKNLSFKRSNRTIFNDVNFFLGPNKIIAVKGKNGSGKTSFLKTILYLLEPSSGSIYWKGKLLTKNLYDYYKNVTYIADKTSSIKQITVEENLKIWKKIFLSDVDFNQIKDILSVLGLNRYLKTKVARISLGEIKKLEFLRLIIENRKIWILDEPFTNLDTDSVNIIAKTFEDHCRNDGSVVFSSHLNPQIRISEEILL